MNEGNYNKITQSDLPHQLAEEHWKYTGGLLEALHTIDREPLEYLYKQAFIHGYKHGMVVVLEHTPSKEKNG